MSQLAIALILYSSTIIRAIWDSLRIPNKSKKISKAGYRKRNVATGGLMIITSIVCSFFSETPWWANLGLAVFSFIATYDYILNIFRFGLKKIAYESPDPDHNSGWERFRQIIPIHGELIIRIICLMTGLGLYLQYDLL